MLKQRKILFALVIVLIAATGISAIALAASGGSLVMSGTDGYGGGALTVSAIDTSDNTVGNCDAIIYVWWDAYGRVFDVDDDCLTTNSTIHHADWSDTNSSVDPLSYPFTLTVFDNAYNDICFTNPDDISCESAFRSGAFACVAEGYYVSPDRGLDDYGNSITPLPLAAEPFYFCGSRSAISVAGIYDDRNNSFDLAAPMAIYCPAGLPHFYGINSEGEGYIVFNVSQEEIDAVGIPEVNTIIKEKWGFQLWRLTTGEYQGVAPRDGEGKIYNVIYEICLPSAETHSWYSY
jgi:hypothetical protein